MRGVSERVRVVRTVERIQVPLIVLGELRAGFAAGSREEENFEILRKSPCSCARAARPVRPP